MMGKIESDRVGITVIIITIITINDMHLSLSSYLDFTNSRKI